MLVKKLKTISKWKDDLIHLIYPHSCLICESEISSHQKHICPFCESDLEYTYFEKYQEPTILDQLFWGRVNVKATYAHLFYDKTKSSQPILHALKYKNKPELGVEMGIKIGENLKEIRGFDTVDALIPVPIHPKKKFVRGYNQSEKIADGIANVLNIPVILDFLTSDKNTSSQTKKNRFLRWDNVEKKFSSKILTEQSYVHVAIIDDVITTGSTLEAIIRTIQENNPEVCVSIISLALTK
jgi:ComF family protein